jgi:hypothetical protein
MSTLALRAEDAAVIAADSWPKALFARLIEAREEEARRRVRSYLASLDDGRLASLGFTEDDICALRNGELRLPMSPPTGR